MAADWGDPPGVRVCWRRRRGRRWVPVGLALAAAVLTLSACGQGSASSSTAVAGPATTVAATTGGRGCGTPTPAGSTTIATTIGGHLRTAIVHVPTGYTGTTEVPLVLNLHGSGGTALAQEAFTGMDATADADGFLVAYPQGLIPAGTGYDWNVPGEPLLGGAAVPADAPDDVAFLTGLVHTLAARYCVDPGRVYATGFSGGARLTSQLACDASSTFAAVAPVSGVRFPTPCPTTRPVPLVAFHGTADPVDPYDGHGQAYWTYSVPTAVRDWAVHNGCAAAPTMKEAATGADLTQYPGCADGADVALYTLVGEGHEWPGGPHLRRALTRELGPQSDAVDANTVIWAFFAAHPMA